MSGSADSTAVRARVECDSAATALATLRRCADNARMSVEFWSTPAFHAQAAAWAASVSAPFGIALTGELNQQQCMPWSTAISLESNDGRLWFKANGPGTAHEGAVVRAVGRLDPALVPEVLAVDTERGWWLMRDAGPTLRSAIPGPNDLWPHWADLLRRYAVSQVRLAGSAAALLPTGLPEVSPQTLPGQAAALIEELAAMDPDEGGLSRDEAVALRSLMPAYRGWCAELAMSGIPSTLQHDDLHSNNICWPGSAVAARIIDWGDASWGHPFGTMLATLNSIAHHARCEIDDPRVERVRDAYLEPFAGYGDRARLVELVRLARRAGCVSRALSYRRALQGAPISTREAEDFPVRGWLLELLEEG